MEEIIVLQGKEFLIVAEINIYNTHYIYAQSIEDDKFTVLKETIENGEKCVESITDEEEIEMVLSTIAKENNIN